MYGEPVTGMTWCSARSIRSNAADCDSVSAQLATFGGITSAAGREAVVRKRESPIRSWVNPMSRDSNCTAEGAPSSAQVCFDGADNLYLVDNEDSQIVYVASLAQKASRATH